MPSRTAIVTFLQERVAAAVAPRTNFAVGAVEDEVYCLIPDESEWIVGYGERGRLRPEGRFANPVQAAKFLIVLLLGRPGQGFAMPPIDWTGYAALPD